MSSEERGRSSYLDLLIATLMEHEKNLDQLIERLEKIQKSLSAILEQTSSRAKKKVVTKEKGKPSAFGLDTLVYMKIRLNREVEEVVRIIESLKE